MDSVRMSKVPSIMTIVSICENNYKVSETATNFAL